MKKTRFLFIFILLPALVFMGGHYALKGYITHSTEAMIEHFGFPDAQIADISYNGSFISLQDIRFDPEGFSSVSSVQISWKALNPFNGQKSYIIDGLVLTGDLTFPFFLDIDGWENKLPTAANLPDITLNDARIDLMTPEGAIRLQAKGLVQKQDNGEISINGALWGVQHQLDIDTRWTGTIRADGSQSYDIDIRKAKLDLDYMSLTRATGEARIEWPSGATMPAINSTMRIGLLDFAGNKLTSTKLKVDGPLGQQNFVIEGFIPGENIMQAGAKIEQLEDSTQIQAAINARALDDLMTFMNRLRTSINQSTWSVGYFMPLLLTEGNLDRIRNDMDGIAYDELQLVVTGSLNDMVGKIVAYRKNDSMGERHIISLDPGFSEP